MNGLDLSEKYYWEVGRPVLKKEFPTYFSNITAGLMGDGSECLGYDDIISQDHDFGPSFCLWLNSEDFKSIGAQMQNTYMQLPKTFRGFPARNTTPYGSDRIGVMEIHEFYSRYIGLEQPPHSLLRWLTLPEEKLAAVTAGKIFEDKKGIFTQIQAELRYYPEDVRLKKIAATAVRMAQSGQYNYSRCMQRNDTVAATFALNEFIKNTIVMIHLLNKRYTPYYKWMYRSLQNLPILKEISPLIQEVVETAHPKIAWNGNSPLLRNPYRYPAVQLIEKICSLISKELQQQELITKPKKNLGLYPQEIIEKIESSELKSLHVLVG